MKRITFIVTAVVALCLGVIAVPLLGSSKAKAAELVSVNDLGTDSGNGISGLSWALVISADGNKVAFDSRASDLVPSDSNGFQDVFVRDLMAGTTTLVNINDLGTDSGNGGSLRPALSADGTKLAFVSFASDLGPTDSNGFADVYVRDLTTATTTLVSVNDSGTDSGDWNSFDPAISADGTKVAFISYSNNLVSSDTNSTADIYVRDLTTATTTLVSVNKLGTDGGNRPSYNPVINSDGTKVAFQSYSSDLGPADTNGFFDVYVRDLTTATTTLVSVNDSGTDSGDWNSFDPTISANGTRIAFGSSASDLVLSDTNGLEDLFVRDLSTATTTLVSINESGTDSGNGYLESNYAALSADGTKVAFHSFASDLVPNDSNGDWDVFVRDLTTATTKLVSVNDSGSDSGNSYSVEPAISADGTKVAFYSYSSDLVSADTNGTDDVFVRDLTTGMTTLVSVNGSGTDSGNDFSVSPVISANGTRIAFIGYANDLGPTDTNGTRDVFIVKVAGPVELISKLIADVSDLNPGEGISNSLNAKLNAAEKVLTDTNTNNDLAAINTLEAFMASVEAQRGKKLTIVEADALITAAQAIIDLLVS